MPAPLLTICVTSGCSCLSPCFLLLFTAGHSLELAAEGRRLAGRVQALLDAKCVIWVKPACSKFEEQGQ
jgi:hypothetical protein